MKNLFSVAFLSSFLFLNGCSDSSSSTSFTLKGSISSSGFAATSASSLKVKVYKFAVSANADCSSPITVFSETSPEYMEMSSAGTLGSSAVGVGTYPCVILEMSDNIKFTPSSTDGPCTSGVEYTIDVCRSDNGDSSTLVDGTAVTCTGTDDGTTQVLGDDRVALYLTTISSPSDSGSSFLAPAAGATTTANGINLAAALDTSVKTTGYFIVDPSGKVNLDSSSLCGMAPPVFSFATP